MIRVCSLQIARKLKGIGDDLDAKVKKEITEATSALLRHKSVFQVRLEKRYDDIMMM